MPEHATSNLVDSSKNPFNPPRRVYAVLYRKLRNLLHLGEFMGGDIVSLSRYWDTHADGVLGWGCRKYSERARIIAHKKNLPFIRLEDGFYRSSLPGVSGATPFSLVVDDLGIYYDARSPSRLEQLLEKGGWESPEILHRARRCIDLILNHQLSKYNHAPDLTSAFPGPRPQKVLVVDQTFGDSSISCGLASEASFREMLVAALEENRQADIIVKTHPDVLAGKKRGHYPIPGITSDRIHYFAEEASPLSLLKQVDRVYVVTSQMGFEALLAEKPVECFGAPFYAGWGLTNDRIEIPRRTRKRSVAELFAAACILYPRYLNPWTNKQGTIEDVLSYLALQRRHMAPLAGRSLYVCGFRWWKRPYIKRLLAAPGTRVRFHTKFRRFKDNETVVVWGAGDKHPVVSDAKKRGIPVMRMEDGFIRSVGLGSNLVRPSSFVLDAKGIYFDPTVPSDLEAILNTTSFSEEERQAGRSLIEQVVTGRFSKYNVGAETSVELHGNKGKRVILVPGQVEDDASIRLGCVDIRTNLGLLMAVRQSNPDAYVIYKPHPDVLVGNRVGAIPEQEALRFCDLVVTDRSMPACLDIADEVHTLTSLTGFEALIHGRKVACYGLPFYAGWGLTQDRHRIERRTASLHLEELVYASLILYPRYYDWERGEICSLEQVLNRIRSQRGGGCMEASGFFQRWGRKIGGFCRSFR